MRNQPGWQPSKYVTRNGTLAASRDVREVGITSRLVTDLVGAYYSSVIPRYASGRLLDLGCGKVPLYATYKDHVTDIVCVDWGNSQHKNDHLDYELDLTKDLPFPTAEFNTIILSDVLEHVSSPEPLWREMARVLAVNGKVIMNVPFYYWLHEQPYDYYRYTEFALRRFIELSGMKLILIEPLGGALEIMADLFAKNIRRLPIAGRPTAIFAQWFALRFSRTTFGKKISKRTSREFPLGYFLIAEKPEAQPV